jgi:hypothetical protein
VNLQRGLAFPHNPHPVGIKVYVPLGEETFDDIRTTEKHKPEQIVAKLRDADTILTT